MKIKNLFFTSLCLLFLAGCKSGQKVKALTSLSEVRPTRREIIGERLYQTYCANCHGEAGEGDGLHSFTLNPPPANHADSTSMSRLSDEHLFEVISKGGAAAGKSAEMPRWKDVLNRNEIENVILYVRTLPEKKGSGQTGLHMREE